MDGNYLAMRNFHAIGIDKVTSQSLITSIFQTIYKIIRNDGYQSQVYVAWDGGHSRYRGSDEDYKGSREYDERFNVLWESINNLHLSLPQTGIISLKFPGVEADDIGYYYSYRALVDNIETKLYSVDRDWLISVNEKCSVVRPNTKDPIWTPEELKKAYKLGDHSFLLYKSILGDSSDEIVGITNNIDQILNYCDQYKNNSIDESIKLKINHNLDLMRLDRIVEDFEVTSSLIEQESKVSYNSKSAISEFFKLMGNNFPQYFYGVSGKYCTMRNMDLFKSKFNKP